MLAGETSIDGGELVFAKGTRVALHDQRPPRERALSLRDYVLSGGAELLALEERAGARSRPRWPTARPSRDARRLRDAPRRGSSTPAATAGASARRDAARPRLRRRATSTASLATFSGGELTRASLARALAGDPDLLLLDEPTNHLDIESLEWLEAHLQTLDAAVVLVAHDRWFLEAVGTAVLELEAGRARFFPGTWHAWRKEQAARELALGRAIEQAAGGDRAAGALRRALPREARRRARRSRASSSSTRCERVERDPRDGKSLGFEFKPPERSGRVIFELEDGDAGGRPTACCSHDAELWLERGEHVSLVGPNGTGQDDADRRALTGERELDARQAAHAATTSSSATCRQHAEELAATRAPCSRPRQRATGLHAEQGARAARPLPVQRRGGREAARRAVSGGERRRLSLAILVHVRRQRPGPRRADQPPRPRAPRGARGRAAGVPGRAAARLPRPRAARRGRHAHGRGRGRHAALLRRRLAGVRARARGAQGGQPRRRRSRSATPRPPSRAWPVPPRTSAARPSGSRRRSSAPRRRCARSRRSWRTRPPGARPQSAKSTRRHERAKAEVERLYAELETVAG